MHLQLIQETINLRRGPAVVTGPSGSGKTQLCQALAEQGDASTFTALITEGVESEEALLTRILREFGLVSEIPPAADSQARVTKQELIDTLVRFLGGLRRIKATAVLIVDDAQRLPESALAQIASLADLEVEREPLLQIVLVGTPDLVDMLRAPEGSSLDQGVAIRCELKAPSSGVRSSGFWEQRHISPVAALGIALLTSALAVGVTAIMYKQLGF